MSRGSTLEQSERGRGQHRGGSPDKKTYTELAWPWFIVSGSLITFAITFAIAFAGRTTSDVLERFRAAAADADAAT